MKIHLFVLLPFLVLAKCSLLEMSKLLWNRVLAGGLTRGSLLDPLRVPVIKVDQSEGNTSYKMVLRNVEIKGLNISTLESVHIARGRLKSNLSDFEAGYVSYSDLRELDSIRYRFHTLVKEPKPKVEPERSEYYTELANLSKVFPMYYNNRNREPEIPRDKVDNRNAFYRRSENVKSQPRDDNVDVVHAVNYKPVERPNPNDQRRQDFIRKGEERRENIGGPKCFGSCIRNENPSRSYSVNFRNGNPERTIENNRKYTEFKEQEQDESEEDDARVSASENFEIKRGFVSVKQPVGAKIISSPETRQNRRYEANERQVELENMRNTNLYRTAQSAKNNSQNKFQLPLGYVDIVYADKDDQKIKHFAGFRRKENQDMKVYGLDEIRKEFQLRNRYLVHNFTATEAIQKRNNMTRAAIESKRIKDLVRYAENFQEKQGYFEQGMQLIYHFGGTDESTNKTVDSNEAKRRKREHDKNDDEDDIIHVIIRLRVPLLQVKADYLLNGKVGQEILRGNGLLSGNFTELIGDFTLELKRVNETSMIVRAARAKLISNQRKVTLQGMREKGPVQSILVHGLMAAEAVAAMIIDDLATKLLSENPPTDAMIYKMYSSDPATLSL